MWPRGKSLQSYYLPPGISRGAPFRNRVDYFDSKKWVLKHLASINGAALESQGDASKPVALAEPAKSEKGAQPPELVEAQPAPEQVQASAASSSDSQSSDSSSSATDYSKANAPAVEAEDVQEVCEQVHVVELPSSDASLAEVVMSLKASIHPSTPEDAIIGTLKKLKALGPFSLELLRTTLVGRAVNALMKHTKHDTVRACAKGLLAAWKDVVSQNTPDSSLPATSAAVDSQALSPILDLEVSAKPARPRVDSKSRTKSVPILAECHALDAAAAAPQPDTRCAPDIKQGKTARKALPDTHQEGSDVKRQRVLSEQLPASDKAQGQDDPSTSATALRSEEGAPCRDCAESLCDGEVPTVNERSTSNDFVLELESGERVVLQCDLEGCIARLRDVCGTDACKACDSQILEAESFWEEFCSMACDF